MQEIIITGLRKTGEHDAIKFARSLAAKWVKTNWMGYKLHNKTMFEKYNVTEVNTKMSASSRLIGSRLLQSEQMELNL